MKEVNIRVNADTKQAEQNLNALGKSADQASQEMLGVAETAFTVAETITGSFAIAVGAVGLFAGENEKMQKVAAKANSVIAIALGVRQLAEQRLNIQILANTAATKLNAAANTATATVMKALGLAVNTTTASFKAMKVALVTTGIGAFVVGLGLLIDKLMKLKGETEEGNKELEDQSALIDRVSQSLQRESELMLELAHATSNLEADQIKQNAQIEKQRDLLKLNNEELAKIIVKYGESSDEAQAFRKTVEDTELVLFDMERNLQNTTKALEEYNNAEQVSIQQTLALQEVRQTLATNTAQMFGNMAALMEEGTQGAKAAGLAEIAINTGVGFIQGLRLAQEAAENTGIAAPAVFAAFYASQIAAVLGAAAQAKAILQSGGTGGTGGGIGGATTYTAPYVPESTEQATPTVTGDGGVGAVQAYVVSSQMTNQQALDEELELQSTL